MKDERPETRKDLRKKKEARREMLDTGYLIPEGWNVDRYKSNKIN